MPVVDGKMTWDAEADRQLLLTVIENQDIKVDTVGVSKKLGCTPLAVRNRIGRLKAMAKPKTEEDGKDKDASKTNGTAQSNASTALSKPAKASKASNPAPMIEATHVAKKPKTAKPTGKPRGRPPKSEQKIATPEVSDEAVKIKPEPKINFGGTHFEPINKSTTKRKRSDVDEEESAGEDVDRKVKEEEEYEDGLENAESVPEEA